jgi:hypothetical protein
LRHFRQQLLVMCDLCASWPLAGIFRSVDLAEMFPQRSRPRAVCVILQRSLLRWIAKMNQELARGKWLDQFGKRGNAAGYLTNAMNTEIAKIAGSILSCLWTLRPLRPLRFTIYRRSVLV